MMLMFWIIVAVLLGLVLVLVLPALLRPAATVDANAEKRAIFRGQFEELEQDKLNGVLDASQYEIAKAELQRRLLEELGTLELPVSNVMPDRRLALVFLLLLPLVAVLLYLKLGSPSSITIPVATPPDASMTQSMAEHSMMAGELESLLDALKAKLEKNPGDGNGWALLARSYVEVKRHKDAVAAYEQAVKVIPNDPQLLTDYADALAVVNNRNLAGKPEELVNQALQLDPHHVKALMLAGTAAFDRKDYKQAISFWERLQQSLPADSELLPDVEASLHEARALSGEKLASPSTEKTQQDKAVSSVGVSGTVRISSTLASKLDPAATLFIFARATQGPPMPLAIVRTTANALPYIYHLDDSTALIPDHKLSQASEVMLVARVSKSGDAKSQAGDLQGVSAAIKPDGRVVDIEINEVVQ